MRIKSNDKVRTFNAGTYHDTKWAGYDACNEAILRFGYRCNPDGIDFNGDEGRVSIPVYTDDCENDDGGWLGELCENFLIFAWHRMATGCYEITAYIS